MGINTIEKDGKDIFIYELPDFYNKDKKLGNKLEDFELLGVLEDGVHSKVLKVRSRLDYGTYAMKQVSLQLINNFGLQKEIDFFMKSNHPKIIKCYNTFDEGGYKYIIMEYMDNGDLESYRQLYHSLDIKIPDKKIWEITYKCLSALVYIHSEEKNREIYLKNILIDDNYNIKIGILNFSSLINSKLNKKENQNKEDIKILGSSIYKLISYGKKGTNDDTDNLISFIQRLMDYNNLQSASEALKIDKELFIKYCVKNSSLRAIFKCFYNFESIKNFFLDKHIINFIFKDSTDKKKLLSRQFSNVIRSLNDKESNKEKFEDDLYELRKTLEKTGFFVGGHSVEIFPEKVIPFILVELNSELNEVILPKNREEKNKDERDRKIFKLLSKQLNLYPLGNQERLAFKVIFNIDNEKVSSFISRNFMSYIKTINRCIKCSYWTLNFSRVHYFQISTKKFFHFDNVKFYYEISNCLNTKKSVFEKCEKCKKKTEHFEANLIYKPAKNLIIIIKRGENYENKAFIDFHQILSLYSEYDKGTVNYKLKGIISKKIKEKNYNYYLLQDNFIWTNSIDGKIISVKLDEIKQNDLIICLFYEIENEKVSLNDMELNQIYNSVVNSQNNNNLIPETDLNLRRTKSEFNSNNNNYNVSGFNNIPNKYTHITKPNQNNYNFMFNNNDNNINNFSNINNQIYMNNNPMTPKIKNNFMTRKHSNLKLNMNKDSKSSDKHIRFNIDPFEYQDLRAQPIDTRNNINIGSNMNNNNFQPSNYLFSDININKVEKKTTRSLSSSLIENNENYISDENNESYDMNNSNKIVNNIGENNFDYVKGNEHPNENEDIGFL